MLELWFLWSLLLELWGDTSLRLVGSVSTWVNYTWHVHGAANKVQLAAEVRCLRVPVWTAAAVMERSSSSEWSSSGKVGEGIVEDGHCFAEGDSMLA